MKYYFEISNTKTSRTFLKSVEKRCHYSESKDFNSLLFFMKNYGLFTTCSGNEKVNLLLFNIKPYIAIKII